MGIFSKKSKSIDITHPHLLGGSRSPTPSGGCKCHDADCYRSDLSSSFGSASRAGSSAASSSGSSYSPSVSSSERTSSDSEAPPHLTVLSPPPAPRKKPSTNFTHEDQMQIVDRMYWDEIDRAKAGPQSCWAREPVLDQVPEEDEGESEQAEHAATTVACPSAGQPGPDTDANAHRTAASMQRELDELVPLAERLVLEASKPAAAYIARASRMVKEARHLQAHMDRPDELEPAIYEMEERLLRVSGIVGLLVAARGKMEWPESRRYPGRWTQQDGQYDITASLVVDDTNQFPYGFNIKSEGPGLYMGCSRQDVTCVINGI